MSNPKLCVGALLVCDQAVLLIRRGNPPGEGRWSLPGGRVRYREPMVQAVARELLEETGLTGEVGELMGWTELINRNRHYVIANFWVWMKTNTTPTAGSDATKAAWVPLKQINDWNLVDGLADFLLKHKVTR